ncbi:hypothetical protein CYMTET_27385, partial [Cymbomonas tetramitiformis]
MRSLYALATLYLSLAVLQGISIVAASHSLHEAARKGDISSINELLASSDVREKINDLDPYGWTPLFWAVDGGKVDAVRALLNHGADVTKGRDGWSALMWACGGIQSEEIVQVFLEEFSADPNAVSADGKSALMVACSSGNIPVVTRLLQHGASVDLAANDGSTALTLAASEGLVQVAKLLLEAGASCEGDGEGTLWRPPLASAVVGGHGELAKLLLSKGARPETRSGEDKAT